jgi:tetratricopeptide (TPR) repeat protein
MTMRISVVVLAVFLAANAARAEDCPDEIPSDSGARRAQAKLWFAKGEGAADAGDQVAALKAYQCSLKLVPHGFTAYNIAQICEQMGDLEMAITGYNQYLLLVPDAKDSQEINDRLDSLRQRLIKLRKEDLGSTAAVTGEPASAQAGAPATKVAEAPAPTPPVPAVEVAGKPEGEVSASAGRQSRSGYRTAAWISYGAAGIFVVGGIVTNLLARSKMDSCRTNYNNGDRPAAESACSDAKPFAYMSYAAFGVGAAAAVLGTIFVLQPTRSSDVAMGLLPEGGLSLRWAGHF